MKKINKKGFTLIELLAVIVVLLLITLVAIPSIASTFERNKNKKNEQKIETIKSAGEIYATRYLKSETASYNEFLNGNCGISIKMLLEKDLLTYDELKDSDGEFLYSNNENTIIVYDRSMGTYTIYTSGKNEC